MNYAGDISCKACWAELESDPSAQLVDVRTAAEWSFVGIPDLGRIAKQVHLVEWQRFPTMDVNPDFAGRVSALVTAAGAKKDSPLYMLCRSGARSISAAMAMTAAGFHRSYNVLDGFEGPTDQAGHRGTVAGWKHDGLDWKQQ